MGAFSLKSSLFKTIFHTNLYSTASNADQSFNKTESITFGEENIWGTSNNNVKYLAPVLQYKSNLWNPSSLHEYFFISFFILLILVLPQMRKKKKRATAEQSDVFFLCPNRNNFSSVLGTMQLHSKESLKVCSMKRPSALNTVLKRKQNQTNDGQLFAWSLRSDASFGQQPNSYSNVKKYILFSIPKFGFNLLKFQIYVVSQYALEISLT